MPKQGRSKALEDSEEDIDYSTWPEGLQQLREELGSTVHYAKKADMKTMYDAIKPDIPKSLQSFLECLREASQEEGKAKIPVSDPDNVIYEKLVGRVVRKRKYDSWFKIAAEAMSSPGCRPEHTWVAQALEAHASISAREAINDRTFYEKVSERSVEILNAKREDLKARLLEEGVQSTWDKLVELRELRAELGVESLAGHPVVPRRPPVEETSWKEEWGECPEDIQKVINICSDKTKRKNFHLSAEQVREIRSRGQYTKDQQLLDIFEYATSGNSSKPIAGLAELSNLNDSTPKDILLNSLSRIVEIYRKLEDSRKQQQASASHLEAVLTSILKHRVMFILRDAKAKAQKESKTYFEDAIRAKRDALLKNTSQVKKSTVEILEALERIEEALGCLVSPTSCLLPRFH